MDIKNNIRKVFYLFFVLFLCLILNFMKFAFIDREVAITNTYNPRLGIMDNTILRGEIKDINGNTLAKTVIEGSSRKRVYEYNEIFSHTVGFVDAGKTGIEAYQNFKLQTIHNEMLNRAIEVLNGDTLKGNNVVTTLDLEISKLAYDAIKKYKGSVIVMEPSTGRIIAMVSTPSFNPNKVASIYEKLSKDEANVPLINRATQGLYPPGSVYKLITAVSAIENYKEYETFTYNCEGQLKIGDNIIRCSGGKKHGDVTLSEAMAVSCNGYFASLGLILGVDNLKNTSEQFMFNKTLQFPLSYSVSKFSLQQIDGDTGILETSFGQGKTLVSPLHMALITSSIANGGVMMKPYIIDHIEYPNGTIADKKMPSMLTRAVDTQTAKIIKDTMVNTVEAGTAGKAKIKNVSVAGKTGTAQNETDMEHGWFVGFAPADNPQVCVVVMLENAGSGSVCVPIGKKLIEAVINE